jgi:hypothetical protein
MWASRLESQPLTEARDHSSNRKRAVDGDDRELVGRDSLRLDKQAIARLQTDVRDIPTHAERSDALAAFS